MSEPWTHCERCGYWVPVSENGRCAGHHREYVTHAPEPLHRTQTFTDLLTQQPALVDALLDTLDSYARKRGRDVMDCRFAFGAESALRNLILAWVARVEAAAARNAQTGTKAPQEAREEPQYDL